MPRVDQLAVDRGLLADGVETGALEKRLGQGMARQRLVEASDGGRGTGERRGEQHRVG